MDTTAARQPSAMIPIAMSLIAASAIIYHLARFGPAPQPDEGTAAHLWQLMMAGQLPVVIYYAARWLPRTPGPAVMVLAAQAGAFLAALAPIYFLGW